MSQERDNSSGCPRGTTKLYLEFGRSSFSWKNCIMKLVLSSI